VAGIDVETKLTAARAALIMEKPFLGALVLRLPLIEADPGWCRSTATDARGFYYNRGYIEKLNFDQTKFMLAHEALHCALAHFARRDHRSKRRWDLACDFAVNPLLVSDGLVPPPGALLSPRFTGMAAEEIYPYLKEDQEEQTLDQHLYDDADETLKHRPRPPNQMPPPMADGKTPPGAPPPAPLSSSERDQLQVQWQQRLAGAAQAAMRAGKLGAHMMRLVDELIQPQLPWRALLAHYLTAAARDDYDFAHPSRREGAAILPGLRSDEVDLVVALDTSGSITADEMREFVSEIDAIKGQVHARIRLLACDERLSDDSPWTAETWEPLEIPKRIDGSGGTRFTPVFDWVAQQERQPHLLVYLTDAEGEFPREEPSYPVLWLVKGKAGVPWGTRIQLN
jgi:predicted metal-dependent peptidase